MDKRGHCHDNIFVERLWWTLKHERGLSRSAVSPGSLANMTDDVPIKRPVGRRRTRRISARANYKAIVEACCIARNKLIAAAARIRSIVTHEYAITVIS